MTKSKKTSVVFRVWFYSDNEKLLGKGRIELLERIKATGSITNAAMQMNMSYRQAWQMVNEMNQRSKLPLVEKHLGGKSGGGTNITKAGEFAIKTFKEFENSVGKFIEKESKKIKLYPI